MNRAASRRGFTLVEILVVFVIIAVLAALLFPLFSRVRASAQKSACISNTRQLLAAQRMYSEDHDRMLVPARTAGAPNSLGYTWCILLQPYMKNERILTCPVDPEPQLADRSTDLPHSYGINYNLTFNTGWTATGFVMSMSTIQRTTDLLLFFGMKSSAQAMGASYTAHRLSRVDGRHNDLANFGFLDGHAEVLRPEETVGAVNMWLP